MSLVLVGGIMDFVDGDEGGFFGMLGSGTVELVLPCSWCSPDYKIVGVS